MTSSATPIAPQRTSTGLEPSTAPPGSGRNGGRSSSRGRGHRAARATKEITSTIAAAQPNNHSGIGRLERWTSPCADADAGAPSALAAISSGGTVRLTARLEAGLDRLVEGLHAEGALEAGGHLAVGAD